MVLLTLCVVPFIKAVSNRTGVVITFAATDLIVSSNSVDTFRESFCLEKSLQENKVNTITKYFMII